MNKLSNNLLNKKRKQAKEEEQIQSNLSTNNATPIISDNDDNYYSINNDNINFRKNPNLKFTININNTNDNHGYNNMFEILYYEKDNIYYIVSPNNITFNLDIIQLENNTVIKNLKGHLNHITTIRNFNQYLLSADINKLVIIWEIIDIKNNIKKYKLKLKYTNWIYSCCLLNNNGYLITSCCGVGYTQMYYFKSNKINNKNFYFCKNFFITKKNCTFYILLWKNQQNSKNYLIECCKSKIVIIDISLNLLYAKFSPYNTKNTFYMNGLIYKDNLYANTMSGYINIWNLYNKNFIDSFYIDNCFLNNFLIWNENYFVIIDSKNSMLKIFDKINKKIVSNIYSQHNHVSFAKKIKHPIYGESIISCGQDNYIKLFTAI